MYSTYAFRCTQNYSSTPKENLYFLLYDIGLCSFMVEIVRDKCRLNMYTFVIYFFLEYAGEPLCDILLKRM